MLSLIAWLAFRPGMPKMRLHVLPDRIHATSPPARPKRPPGLVHHERPDLPWFRLRRHCLAHRDEVLRRNGNFLLPGYLPLIGRHASVAVDSPVHSHRADR